MAFQEYRPTETLFQYCSAEALPAILQSKCLWFSDLAAANDPRELHVGFEHFMEAVKSVRHNEYRGPNGLFLSVLAGRLAPYRDNVQAFSCCFSLAVDELPMWGAYGANYGGVALGFRPTAISAMPARIQKVRYVDGNTSAEFRKLILDVAAEFDPKRPSDDLGYWIPATVSVFAAMTALKHATWSYEREVRLVHLQTIASPNDDDPITSITDYLPNGQPVRWTEPLTRIGGNRSIPYLEFSFGRFKDGAFEPSGAIQKIIIGPNCELQVSNVAAMLDGNGYRNYSVIKSACQIR